MNKIEFMELLKKGEDSYTEFKEEKVHPEKLAKTIVAFANTAGGNLIIGVADDCEITGISNFDKEMQRIDNICANNCEPPIFPEMERLFYEDKKILIIKIPKGSQRPYRTNKGIYYVKTASGKRIASSGELKEIQQASGSIYYDELPIPNTSLENIDLKYVDSFLFTYLKKQIDDFDLKVDILLKNLKILTLYENRTVTTIGGMLFFGKNPEFQFPYCKITIVRFPGNDIGEKFEKKDIEGKIIEQIDRTETILKDFLRSETEIIGFQKEEPKYEIPIEVLREVVINAIAHRNYRLLSQIRIFIFDNRIEIKSPGKLPNTITIENIKFGSFFHRNHLIVSFLTKVHKMTEIGTGITRVIRLLKKHTGKEPEFIETDNEFIVRIWRDLKFR